MQAIDKIVLGDNQFFGINHMSQEKAQQLAEKFSILTTFFMFIRLPSMQVSGQLCLTAMIGQEIFVNISELIV